MGSMIVAAYTRFYSEIPAMQRANQVEYVLYDTGGSLRLVVRTEHCGPVGRHAAVCELPGMDTAFACGLLRFLYENGVPVEHVRDVVQDLLSEEEDRETSADMCRMEEVGRQPLMWSNVR